MFRSSRWVAKLCRKVCGVTLGELGHVRGMRSIMKFKARAFAGCEYNLIHIKIFFRKGTTSLR